METDNEQIILDGIIDLFKNNQYEEAYKKLNTIKFNKIEKYFLIIAYLFMFNNKT